VFGLRLDGLIVIDLIGLVVFVGVEMMKAKQSNGQRLSHGSLVLLFIIIFWSVFFSYFFLDWI
jgi:hypothetical protein